MIDKDRNNEIVSDKQNIAEKFNNYFDNIGNMYGENFHDRYAFEHYMSSANVSEPFKFSNFRLESLGFRRLQTVKSLFRF